MRDDNVAFGQTFQHGTILKSAFDRKKKFCSSLTDSHKHIDAKGAKRKHTPCTTLETKSLVKCIKSMSDVHCLHLKKKKEKQKELTERGKMLKKNLFGNLFLCNKNVYNNFILVFVFLQYCRSE